MEHPQDAGERASLFKSIPDTGSMTCEPKTKFTVEVIETAMPVWSTIELWLCAEVSPRPTSDRFETYSPMICWYIEHRIIIVGSVGSILTQRLLVN